jgi:hypothetical protein
MPSSSDNVRRVGAALQELTAPTAPKHPSASAERETCTLAGLARILARRYGDEAPTESTLKKWSGAGVFEGCQAHGRRAAVRPPGRPGFRLDVEKSVARIKSQWPHLADTSPIPPEPVPSPSPFPDALPNADQAAVPPAPAAAPAELAAISIQIAALQEEMRAVRREVAQFSAMRNNLVTRLDEVVARAQDLVTIGSRNGGGGSDPLVEARRDRDMGVLKSMLSEVLQALESRR